MATKTIVELTDDVNGEPAEESLTFGLDGEIYEIDLTIANAEELREAFDEFIAHARRTGRTLVPSQVKAEAKKGKTSRKAMTRIELPDVRPGITAQERKSMQKFAKANDLKVPAERGRIAADIVTAWEDAGRPT